MAPRVGGHGQDAKDRLLRFRRGKEVRRVRGHARLLALMRWDRGRRLLWPWGGVAGEGYAPNPPGLEG